MPCGARRRSHTLLATALAARYRLAAKRAALNEQRGICG